MLITTYTSLSMRSHNKNSSMHNGLKYLTLLSFYSGENNNGRKLHICGECMTPKMIFPSVHKIHFIWETKKFIAFNRIYLLHQNNQIQNQEKQLNCVLLTLNWNLGLLSDKNNTYVYTNFYETSYNEYGWNSLYFGFSMSKRN